MNNQYIPILKLEGRSGCRLEVMLRGSVTFVRKYSKEQSYNSRLVLQSGKQAVFYSENLHRNFSTPEVLVQATAASNSETWFDMQYVHGQKFSEYLERSSIQEIKQFKDKLVCYFEVLFDHASIQPADATIFLTKTESLRTLLANRTDVDRDVVDRAMNFLLTLPATTIPLFECHGDFTFSNMLFRDDKIYLVDFLDSFIESPLIDFVKLRQDTFFHWSLMIEKDIPENRKSKIVQVFRYLDQEIVNAFKGNIFVQEWYNYLQVFNLLRIMPYVQHPAEIEFVQQGIARILPR